MAKIRSDLQLTDRGMFLFNAAQPILNERDDFNVNCRASAVETAVLGCYAAENIFIYNIVDDELQGIRELTTAHELLHVVYAKMSSNERAVFKNDLDEVYSDNRAVLEEDLKIYSETERYEELYVRAGTQVKKLPDSLEEHYAKIFKDQDRIVDFYESYIAVFKRLKTEIEALEKQLDVLDAEIDSKTASYEQRAKDYSARVDEFNDCADRIGCFTTESEFYSRRNNLENERAAIDALYAELNNLVIKYNELVKKYNGYVLETEQLNNKINSSIKPNNIK